MPYLFQKRGIRVIYKGSIFVQKSIAVNPQRICKCHRYIVLNGVSVILIQNQCRGHNANLFCQFPCGETLECPVILQILARCGAFFIGFVVKGQMNHDFAFRIEVNPCVIEITIGKAKIHLQAYLDTRSDADPALFVTLDSPHARLKISGVEIRLRELGRRLGISRIHPHKFRRTMATRAIDKGMPIEQVQKILGHSQIDTTMQYAIVNQTNVKTSHQKFIA